MEIYDKGGVEKTVIMAVRQALSQRFVAPNWLDLRVGFLLSITDKTNNDTISGLAETIDAGGPDGLLGIWDRYYIGVVHDETKQTYIGFTNRGRSPSSSRTVGSSILSLSDGGIATGTNFYWPHNSRNNNWSGQVLDLFNGRSQVRVQSTDGVQQHFVANAGGAGGYATLLMLRLQRDDVFGRSNILTITMKQGTHSTDVLYTNDPSFALLDANMKGFPSTVQTWGPIEVAQVPDSIFLYWPWSKSRLRIHAMGVEKIAV